MRLAIYYFVFLSLAGATLSRDGMVLGESYSCNLVWDTLQCAVNVSYVWLFLISTLSLSKVNRIDVDPRHREGKAGLKDMEEHTDCGIVQREHKVEGNPRPKSP